MTVDEARAAILAKLRKAGVKSASALATKAVLASNAAVFDEALATLEREVALSIDRSKAKPKYFLTEFAPSHRKISQEELRKLVDR